MLTGCSDKYSHRTVAQSEEAPFGNAGYAHSDQTRPYTIKEQGDRTKGPARSELLMTHREFHVASFIHSEHRARNGPGVVQDLPEFDKNGLLFEQGPPVSLPVIPKSPPVCSQPPPMRFCKNVAYPVYRPSAEHTFAQLDFDSHAVFKKIAPHMRISERHFELAEISACRANFRQFLCLRNFPRCCHVGLCSEYGAPEPPLTADSLSLVPPFAQAPPPPGTGEQEDLEHKATKVGGCARRQHLKHRDCRRRYSHTHLTRYSHTLFPHAFRRCSHTLFDISQTRYFLATAALATVRTHARDREHAAPAKD